MVLWEEEMQNSNLSAPEAHPDGASTSAVTPTQGLALFQPNDENENPNFGAPAVLQLEAVLPPERNAPTINFHQLDDPAVKRRIFGVLEWQLIVLLHAYFCLVHRPLQRNTECKLRGCGIMKRRLKHIRRCRNKSCLLCGHFKSLVRHWASCTHLNCPICKNLRRAAERRRNNN